MRSVALITVIAAAAGTAVVPALASDPRVEATIDNKFAPATVTVRPGEQVTFHDGVTGGYHNVHFADGPGNAPHFGPWTYSRRFAKPGRYPFVCDIHVSSGMRGEVVVLEPDGSVPPPAAPPGSQPPPSGAARQPAAAPGFSIHATRARFCARGCPRPGVVLRVTLSAPATVAGRLERRSRTGVWRRDGRVRFGAPAGRHTVTIRVREDGRRIGLGRYRLTLRARAHDGRASTQRVVTFSVV